jgi:acetylornithine deacetylase
VNDPATDPLPLAIELMEIDSTSGAEGAVVALAERRLAERGWRVRRIAVTPGRDCLLATAGDAPVATLSTHLDTVPPYIPPRVEGSRLTAGARATPRGSPPRWCARGSGCATAACRWRSCSWWGGDVPRRRARGQREPAPSGVGARAGERRATESTLALGTKGALRFTVRTRGRAAHSAYPHLGDSATARLVEILGELDGLELPTDELLGDTTVNIGTLAGGVADNVIAPWAEARLMARLVTDPEAAFALFARWVGERAEVEQGVRVPPVRLGVVPGFPTSVAAFATDIPELGAWGTPYLFGPGSIHVAHTDHEHVELAELRAAVGAYERLVELAVGAVR